MRLAARALAIGRTFASVCFLTALSVHAQQGYPNRPVRLIVVDNASTVSLPDLPNAEVVRSPARLTLGEAVLERRRAPLLGIRDQLGEAARDAGVACKGAMLGAGELQTPAGLGDHRCGAGSAGTRDEVGENRIHGSL